VASVEEGGGGCAVAHGAFGAVHPRRSAATRAITRDPSGGSTSLVGSHYRVRPLLMTLLFDPDTAALVAVGALV